MIETMQELKETIKTIKEERTGKYEFLYLDNYLQEMLETDMSIFEGNYEELEYCYGVEIDDIEYTEEEERFLEENHLAKNRHYEDVYVKFRLVYEDEEQEIALSTFVELEEIYIN